MKEIQWSATNDPTVWENDDAGVIHFATEADAQKMMRFLATARPEAGAHDAILEAAAVLCETNNLLAGSNGPLMDHGWKCCQQACADGIRKMKRSPPQEKSNVD